MSTKAKKKKIDVEKLNIMIAVRQIEAAPIPDEIKIQAIDDIIKMVKDDEYGKTALRHFAFWESKNASYLTPIDVSIDWNSSDLGHDFWHKMDTIIEEK